VAVNLPTCGAHTHHDEVTRVTPPPPKNDNLDGIHCRPELTGLTRTRERERRTSTRALQVVMVVAISMPVASILEGTARNR
jgi:hypothetical protein